MCDQVVEIIREERGKLVVTSLQIMRGSKCPDNAGVEVIRGSRKIAVIQGKPSSTPWELLPTRTKGANPLKDIFGCHEFPTQCTSSASFPTYHRWFTKFQHQSINIIIITVSLATRPPEDHEATQAGSNGKMAVIWCRPFLTLITRTDRSARETAWASLLLFLLLLD